MIPPAFIEHKVVLLKVPEQHGDVRVGPPTEAFADFIDGIMSRASVRTQDHDKILRPRSFSQFEHGLSEHITKIAHDTAVAGDQF